MYNLPVIGQRDPATLDHHLPSQNPYVMPKYCTLISRPGMFLESHNISSHHYLARRLFIIAALLETIRCERKTPIPTPSNHRHRSRPYANERPDLYIAFIFHLQQFPQFPSYVCGRSFVIRALNTATCVTKAPHISNSSVPRYRDSSLYGNEGRNRGWEEGMYRFVLAQLNN